MLPSLACVQLITSPLSQGVIFRENSRKISGLFASFCENNPNPNLNPNINPNLNPKANPNPRNICTENSELGPLFSVNFK